MSTHYFRNFMSLLLVLGIVAGVAACKPAVTREDPNLVKDLSGKWNDTDSRKVSEEMIQDVLSQPWLGKFNSKKGRIPTIIIGKVRNLSHEHINTQTFTSDIRRALINSGEVSFVASSEERGEIRKERKDQDLHASEDTRKEMGNEAGADFMLKGTINTIIDAIEGEQVRFYQVDLTLIDLSSNRMVWAGQQKIKKSVERSSIRL
ncbi:MAG: penicillin-binding protein activator LpoB [Gammaproteobacteria bacterium]|nr:penicillin-binding protein activator LpoB [Gammaproteobacteria bacterium]